MAIPATSIRYAEITMKGLIAAGGSNTVNTQFVFHARRTAVVVTPTKTALDTAFQASWAVPILAALNNRWSQKTNEIRWIDDALDQALPFTHVNAGAVAGDGLQSDSSFFVLFRTGIRGKSYKGGKHFGPLSEADATAGTDDVLNAAAITRATAIMTALAIPITDATGNVWNLSLVSKVLSTLTPNPTTIVANDVTTLLLNKRISTMKRRKAKSSY